MDKKIESAKNFEALVELSKMVEGENIYKFMYSVFSKAISIDTLKGLNHKDSSEGYVEGLSEYLKSLRTIDDTLGFTKVISDSYDGVIYNKLNAEAEETLTELYFTLKSGPTVEKPSYVAYIHAFGELFETLYNIDPLFFITAYRVYYNFALFNAYDRYHGSSSLNAFKLFEPLMTDKVSKLSRAVYADEYMELLKTNGHRYTTGTMLHRIYTEKSAFVSMVRDEVNNFISDITSTNHNFNLTFIERVNDVSSDLILEYIQSVYNKNYLFLLKRAELSGITAEERQLEPTSFLNLSLLTNITDMIPENINNSLVRILTLSPEKTKEDGSKGMLDLFNECTDCLATKYLRETDFNEYGDIIKFMKGLPIKCHICVPAIANYLTKGLKDKEVEDGELEEGLVIDHLVKRFIQLINKYNPNANLTVEQLLKDIVNKVIYHPIMKTNVVPENTMNVYKHLFLRHVMSEYLHGVYTAEELKEISNDFEKKHGVNMYQEFDTEVMSSMFKKVARSKEFNVPSGVPLSTFGKHDLFTSLMDAMSSLFLLILSYNASNDSNDMHSKLRDNGFFNISCDLLIEEFKILINS
ncbi:MAG: hypothetical protein ACRC92_20605 [Peptostreptococcaceae bacterium]